MAERFEFNIPGLGHLRAAVSFAVKRSPGPATLRRDGMAGLTVTIASIPSGMANGLLAGVNPIFGLYANMVGPVVGGVLSSSRLMVINSTSAAALVAGQALGGEADDASLFLMVLLAGFIAVVLGLLRLGRLASFVSFSVMTGFIAGIAAVLTLSQLPTVTGFTATADSTVGQVVELLSNLDEIHLPSLAMAGLAVVLALGLRPTPLTKLASLAAVVVPTAVVILLSIDDVAMVRDVGEVAGGLPMPRLPSVDDFSLNVVTGAFSVALVTLVQGAGVSQAVPNPGGARVDTSRDFVAQGAANIGAGLFGGLPVGGSLGGTALSIISGARRRWAAVISGLLMAIIVLSIPGVVSVVVMPTLGALLIIAGISAVNPSEVASVWRAGWHARVVAIATFVAVLFTPMQVAVGIGVALSIVMFVNAGSTDITVVEQVEQSDGTIEERSAPKRLPDREVTVLDVYGDLFFAGARRLHQLLPTPRGASHPVVILRLRGRRQFGATLVEVLSGYAEKIKDADGRLYLTGLDPAARQQLLDNGTFRSSGPAQAYEATAVLGESTRSAHASAEEWLASGPDDKSDRNNRE